MAQKITSAFRFRRKALFMLACVLLVVAVAHRPWTLLFAFSAKGLINTLVLVVGGLLGVIAIHEFAQLVLRGRGEPWYTRRGSLAFLPIGLRRRNPGHRDLVDILGTLGVRAAERDVVEAVRTLYPKGLPQGTIEAPVIRKVLRYLQGNCKKSV
jgi:hypothetical protein